MMFEDVNVSNHVMIDLVYCHRNYKRMTKTLANLCTIQIVNQLQCKSGFQGSIIRFIKIHRSVKMSGQEVFVKVGHMCIHIYTVGFSQGGSFSLRDVIFFTLMADYDQFWHVSAAFIQLVAQGNHVCWPGTSKF